ncbi:hypothetical protein ACTJJ0_21430 [Chitinophaga sp. 22321]|uniref:Uncharacterized protein n=1 Tax=Chitinophaga hostae TaxID=2831022 RepID=A0ABS5J495_9BACT|nr:hypothetical protein [Chitinophaga hostae]MBS0030050.1 hypothetical protein [Chitinophaga hostae]
MKDFFLNNIYPDVHYLFYAVFGALGYVLLQSLFILGVRIAAKGVTEKMPDGKDDDSEMILFPVFKYLHQSTKRSVYFEGDQFENLIRRLRILLPGFDLQVSGNALRLDRQDPRRVAILQALNNTLSQVDNQVQVAIDDEGVRFYKVYEKFRFNKYLRKPVIGCPICMASYWSTFSYWIPVIYLFGFNFWVLYLGVINICAVACSNWLLFSRGK